VLLERTATAGPHHEVFESVVTDHALGAAMAVRHLVALGHRKVGVALDRHSPTRPHVHRGWLEAAIECGIDTGATVESILPDARSPERDAALDAVLDRCLSTGTTAMLVHADAEAVALVQRCEERHLSVPGDLSIVAYDDEVAGLFSPPLTAIRPPRRSIGRPAVRLVADRLADPDGPPTAWSSARRCGSADRRRRRAPEWSARHRDDVLCGQRRRRRGDRAPRRRPSSRRQLRAG
jgi:DNA-binding LacI/PurR family transcriptional regulator